MIWKKNGNKKNEILKITLNKKVDFYEIAKSLWYVDRRCVLKNDDWNTQIYPTKVAQTDERCTKLVQTNETRQGHQMNKDMTFARKKDGHKQDDTLTPVSYVMWH